jgi:signal transduction histidine kinase
MTSARAQSLSHGARARACRLLLVILAAAIALPGFASAQERSHAPLSQYAYKDTKNLVTLVEDAAKLMERDGDKAFEQFAVQDSRWLNDDYYMFVYALDGICLFHPISPELVGKSMISLQDMHGKPIIREITDIGKKPGADANGWVFYLWQNQTQITPSWKSAYIRKVVGPDGKTYVVGSGSYNIKVEKPFVEDRVRSAAQLLQSSDRSEAFKQIQDPASQFVFLDSFVFVMNAEGRTLVDPAFPNMAGRDLSDFRDAVGFYAIREVLNNIKNY